MNERVLLCNWTLYGKTDFRFKNQKTSVFLRKGIIVPSETAEACVFTLIFAGFYKHCGFKILAKNRLVQTIMKTYMKVNFGPGNFMNCQCYMSTHVQFNQIS